MRREVERKDAVRMLSELRSVKVTCEECGRSTDMGFDELQGASFAGVYSYGRLCERLKCNKCDDKPGKWRRLVVSPTWRSVGSQVIA